MFEIFTNDHNAKKIIIYDKNVSSYKIFIILNSETICCSLSQSAYLSNLLSVKELHCHSNRLLIPKLSGQSVVKLT